MHKDHDKLIESETKQLEKSLSLFDRMELLSQNTTALPLSRPNRVIKKLSGMFSSKTTSKSAYLSMSTSEADALCTPLLSSPESSKRDSLSGDVSTQDSSSSVPPKSSKRRGRLLPIQFGKSKEQTD